ncbi:hypothetical protein HCN44_004465 [Aphidius gifuensis]|uniref:Uncharacterized protein n=1 Tax=Aphidius gifuensis TaxID=684658 RepID=A0A834XWV5_APHGI|nr:uncharacterized protein LOC122848771 [Aphidius gifuensis]KAF7994993.1 hypothetical protein HCN44_004465 [Aphidius gifuensis]
MFSIENSTKSILLCGPPSITRTFMFESAIHWAEKDQRVFYITPAPLTSIPAKYHDRNDLIPTTFNMIRFMHLSSYESLVEQLVNIHTFEVRPSVLLIDRLDTYIQIKDPKVKEQHEVHIARLCAIIHDSMNACSRLKKVQVHICVSVSPDNFKTNIYQHYFDSIWRFDKNNEGIVELKKIKGDLDYQDVFRYEKYVDGTVILNSVLELCKNNSSTHKIT